MTRRTDSLRTPVRTLPPLFRMGVPARLVAAVLLTGLLWAAIAWASV